MRKCVIRGFLPLFFCGQGAYHRNFTDHYDDVFPKGPSGGGHGSMVFNLSFLYQEFKKHHNKWSRSNLDFDLVRYKGTVIKLYRHQDFDYIVWISRTPPFQESLLTVMTHQPSIMLQAKKCIIVKSYRTHPGGKPYVTAKVRPPRLLTDKWYFQSDFCNVPLFSLQFALAELRFPICSPQTDTNCINFLVLDDIYYKFLDNKPKQSSDPNDENRITFWHSLWSTMRYLNTTYINTLFPGTDTLVAAKDTDSSARKYPATGTKYPYKDSQYMQDIWKQEKIQELYK